MYRWIFFGKAALAIAAALYFFHVRLGPSDLPFYRKLVQESIDLHTYSALEKSPVRQMRKGVRKDIWMTQNGERRHIQIESLQSQLTLRQKKGKMEATEHLKGIEAWIDLKHLSAEAGTCYFPSCRMEMRHLTTHSEESNGFAKETHWTKDSLKFLGPFHMEYPEGRLFGEQGTLTSFQGSNRFECKEGIRFEAIKAPFSISSLRASAILPEKRKILGEEIHFSEEVEIQTASGIRAFGHSATLSENFLRLLPEPGSSASMLHREGQITAREIRFDRLSNELLFLTPHGVFQEGKTLFDADTGRAHFLENHLHTILLEGNVRIASSLQGKESSAKADSALLYLDPKKLILESEPLSRVLFRQEGLQISAPTVHIQDAVQGFGDVRFFFYPEEKTVLDNLFIIPFIKNNA